MGATEHRGNSVRTGGAFIFLTPCEAGYFCPSDDMTSAVLCASGSYCPAGSMSEEPCPAGTFCPTPNESTECPAGSVCPLGSTSFTICGSGSHCPAGTTSEEPCPTGSHCVTPATIQVCAPGSHCPARSTSEEPCPAGTFCPSPSDSTECPAGSACPEGSTSPTACASGSYCPAGSTSAQPCPPGSFCTNSTTIDVCGAGSYCPAGSTLEDPCPSGTYCPFANVSIACPTWSACAEGSTAAVTCPSDTYISSDLTSCESCPDPDYYKVKKDRTGCEELHCFCLDTFSIIIVVGFTFVAASAGLVFGRVGAANTVIISLSMGDLFSDILYVSLEPFWSPVLQWLCLIFIVAPTVGFLYMFPPSTTFLKCAWVRPLTWPGMWIRWPCLQGEPIAGSNSSTADDDFPLVLLNALFTLGHWVMCLLSWIFVVVFLVFVWPVIVLLFACFGLVLFATKLLAIPSVSAFYIRIWRAGAVEIDGQNDTVVLLEDFNKMLVTEMCLESIPQLVVQLINNKSNYGTVAILSLTYTLFVIVCHFWKFVRFMSRGVSMFEVPTLFGFANYATRKDTYGSRGRSSVEMRTA